MSPEEFNALPLEARRYISNQRSCLSCGKSQDLDTLYKNYLAMIKQALYTLRLGAVLYKKKDGTGGILYPIHPNDSEEVIKEKLSTALEVYAVAPGRFTDIQEEKITKILGAVEVAEIATEAAETAQKPVKKLFGAAKAAADKKAKASEEVDDLE